MYERKRIYILVKTYPTISREYSELVCTAGILEDGGWIRLYPVPFRKLELEQKYPKFSWIEVEVERNTADFRPESYRPNLASLVVEKKSKTPNWNERNKIIFKKQKVYTNFAELIEPAKRSNVSLAIFKPTKILNFIAEKVERDWDPKKLASLKLLSQQLDLFKTAKEIENEFKLVRKVPYKFSYIFQDDSGNTTTRMIEDWEIGMLYFNCLKRNNGDEQAAISDIKNTYFNKLLKRDLYFFMGTMLQYHKIMDNPFIIIGVYYPPANLPPEQLSFSF